MVLCHFQVIIAHLPLLKFYETQEILNLLLFKGVHLLLGNDLAGDKVVVNPLVTDTSNIGQTDDPIEQEIPDLYPSCTVTRAMAKKGHFERLKL